MTGFILAAGRMFRAMTPTAWLAIAILAAFLLFGGYCAHRAVQGERDRQAAVTAKDAAKASTARETAAVERSNDTSIINAQEKAQIDAVQSLPDGRPSPRRVARACQLLRQQGTAEPDLPIACRSGG